MLLQMRIYSIIGLSYVGMWDLNMRARKSVGFESNLHNYYKCMSSCERNTFCYCVGEAKLKDSYVSWALQLVQLDWDRIVWGIEHINLKFSSTER